MSKKGKILLSCFIAFILQYIVLVAEGGSIIGLIISISLFTITGFIFLLRPNLKPIGIGFLLGTGLLSCTAYMMLQIQC